MSRVGSPFPADLADTRALGSDRRPGDTNPADRSGILRGPQLHHGERLHGVLSGPGRGAVATHVSATNPSGSVANDDADVQATSRIRRPPPAPQKFLTAYACAGEDAEFSAIAAYSISCTAEPVLPNR